MSYIKPKLTIVEYSYETILTTSWLDIGDNLSGENSKWWGEN